MPLVLFLFLFFSCGVFLFPGKKAAASFLDVIVVVCIFYCLLLVP